MQTALPGPAATEASHFQAALDDLNVRIARLAIALKVPLVSDVDLQSALKNLGQPAIATERRSGSDRRSATRSQEGPERRLSYQRAELRGLLVMRYDVEVKLCDEVGAAAAQQIMESSVATLGRQGFHLGKPGL